VKLAPWMRGRLATPCALLLASAGCARAPATPSPISHDAYIWQRRWTPALGQAMADSRDFIRGWRILAAEMNAEGTTVKVGLDVDAVRSTRRPVVAVLRIDGQIPDWNDRRVDDLAAELVAEIERQGVELAGLEIDYDCGTQRLRAYAALLGRLRKELAGHGTRDLSITFLPTWLDDVAAPQLLRNVDEVVLQTHSVASPARTLFEPTKARAWLRKLATLRPARYRVALPTYGHRVSIAGDGRVLAVESEAPRGFGGVPSRDWFAGPLAVSQLVRELESHPPPGFAGITWFRLPTRGDRRAWSLRTWRAVASGSLGRGRATVWAVATATPHAFDLVAVNDSQLDRELPLSFDVVGQGCDDADVVAHYRLGEGERGIRFVLEDSALLASGQRRLVGWVRCDSGAGEIDVLTN